MIFNSFQFLWLFPIVFFLNYLLNRANSTGGGKIRRENSFLLITSYLLYAQWNPLFTLVLLYVTFVTYWGAIWLEKCDSHRRKILVGIFSLSGFLPLLTFKYYLFITESIGSILSIIGIHVGLQGLNWAVPLGLSFFTFQAIGYLLDVYHQRVDAERNWFDYMLFVSFFPQILSGPISKAEELLPQIKSQRKFDERMAAEGMKILMWGMFMKVCMADRLGIYVDSVYKNYEYNSGNTLFLASLAYTLQIYGDFAGYSLMAIGVGKTLGFNLVTNFERPYFATSITEFWKRWHVSLTRWLTTHIYISLGGNRCSKLKQYWNIMITFLVSGLWHGANWTFVLWGVLHGLLQIIEKAMGLDPKGKYSATSHNGFLTKMIRTFITFMLVTIAWILFRSPNIEVAYTIIARIFMDNEIGITTGIGVSAMVFFLPVIMVISTEFIDEYYPGHLELLHSRHVGVRWLSYITILTMILLFGVLDSSNFIYVSF